MDSTLCWDTDSKTGKKINKPMESSIVEGGDGNGTYTDYDKSIAIYYTYDSGISDNGEIMEMLLTEDAKTISFVDIYTEYEKTGIPKLIADKRDAFQDIIGDVGTYAAIKG